VQKRGVVTVLPVKSPSDRRQRVFVPRGVVPPQGQVAKCVAAHEWGFTLIIGV